MVDEDKVLSFANQLKIIISRLIYIIIMENPREITNLQILDILKNKMSAYISNELFYSLNGLRFNIAVSDYMIGLIRLIRKILQLSSINATISPTRLARDSEQNLLFGRKTIEIITHYLQRYNDTGL